MTEDPGIFIGKGSRPAYLAPRLANRHGLIAGATGTGKTVSLQVLAEDFSRRGVPVFMADVKGDLSGLSQPGRANPKLSGRAEAIGLDDYVFEAFPVVYLSLGICEPHGLYNPLGLDELKTYGICLRAAREGGVKPKS